MKVLVLNGPNINMLGIREPEIYGSSTYRELVGFIEEKAVNLGLEVEIFQSNCEGALIDRIQDGYGKYDAIIINAGGYTHTSVAIYDALKAVGIPVVEVHLSDISKREDFRRKSMISPIASATFMGKGFDSYLDALSYCKSIAI